MEYFLLFVGLGFFLFIVVLALRTEREDYSRKLNEQREFGFRFPHPRKHRDESRD